MEGIGLFTAGPSLMVLEMEEESRRISGLLQTCPFSFYVNLVVREEECGGGGGNRNQEPGRLGVVLVGFGVEPIFTAYSDAGRIFFYV